MSLHTPAPWTVELDVVDNGDIHVFAAGMLPVASVDVRECPEDTEYAPREVALANARLIAAAPDLLEACKRALPYLADQTLDEAYDLMVAAIAKAEAQS